jgi:hypothetical protein
MTILREKTCCYSTLEMVSLIFYSDMKITSGREEHAKYNRNESDSNFYTQGVET